MEVGSSGLMKWVWKCLDKNWDDGCTFPPPFSWVLSTRWKVADPVLGTSSRVEGKSTE